MDGRHAKMIRQHGSGRQDNARDASGVSDTRNDIILCSFVEASSMKRRRRLSKTIPIYKFRRHPSKSCMSGRCEA